MLQQIGTLLQYCILVFLTWQVAYLLFFSVAATLSKPTIFPPAKTLRKIRIYIPGYKEDAVIIATAKDALCQIYPVELFEVVVIADSFSEQTLAALHRLPIKIIQVKFEKSTKGKALHQAIQVMANDPVDIVLILDADNHMAPGFLDAVNNAFEQGYLAVQGHRTAKNMGSPFAFLDACTEEVNNHIFRRGHVAAGLPCALIGSGMAFDEPLFISLLQNIGDTAGEDKELEFRLLRQRKKIAFLDGEYVYDEKVATTHVFSKQRSRWLAMQAEFFKKYFIEGWVQLFKGNIAFFDKAVQTYLLPRVMLVATLLLWLVWVFIFSHQLMFFSIGLTIALAASLFMGIPYSWYNKKLLFAFLQIPAALLSMVKALLHSGKARNQFIHTPHGDSSTNNQ